MVQNVSSTRSRENTGEKWDGIWKRIGSFFYELYFWGR